MKPLWPRLQSPLVAAGLALSLAACGRPAARPSRAASPPPAPAPASVGAVVERETPSPATTPAGRPPAAPAVRHDFAGLAALAETDPRAALLAAGSADLGASADYIRGNFLQQWAARDFTAALAHADRQPPGPARDEMFARLALLLAEALPHEAAAIVAEDMDPGEIRAEAAISVLHRWAPGDPAAAAAWAGTFPPGPLRERALAEVRNAAPPPPR